jgi:O-antigen ligase
MIYIAATVINCLFDWKTINEKSFIRIGYTLFILFYYYIITSCCFNREDIKKILYLNALAGLFIALLIIKNWCGGAKGKISLISFFHVSIEENYTGALLAFIVVLSFLMLKFEKEKLNKIFIFVVIGFCVFAVCLTGSRAAFIGIILSLTVMGIQYLFARKVSFLKKVFWIVLCIVICIVLYTQLEHILPSFLYNRLFTNSLNDNSNADRLILWKNGFNGFLNRPFLGYGVGNFNYYVRLIFPQHKVVVAHNSFLDILIDVGIIGFGVFAVMVYKNIKYIFREGKVFIPLFVCFLFTALIVGGERTFFFWNDIIILTLISKCFSDKLVKSTDEL